MSEPNRDSPDSRIREPGAGSEWITTASPPTPRADSWDDDFDRDRPKRHEGTDDANHLRLLSIFHYVVGGIVGLFATIPVIHLAIGLSMVSGRFPTSPGSGPPPPLALGWMFVIFASAFIVLGWALAICLFVAGTFLRRRRHYMFCLVTAGLACTFQPFGLVLGIFTIIVLIRPSVKALFGRATSTAGVDRSQSL
jgi:hypothetical protein